ncbi:MAG: alpha/beta hydrolase [Geitlerinemataceae cyanobacterium]
MQNILLILSTFYQGISSIIEDRKSPPGKRINVGNCSLHLYSVGEGKPTIVIDHSLGGVEGYLLVNRLAHFGRVCIYDRAGYGWSDCSPDSRTSAQIVNELETLLTRAQIEPPYILIGDSFGSYNMRLYAHRFPEKVVGLVLTDGLHEDGMLNMPASLRILKLIFISGFWMSVLGSILGIIRLLKNGKAFEFLKPELREFHQSELASIKRSFCRPKHWWTMSRELWSLDASGHQVKTAKQLENLPIINIKANSFFKPSFLTRLTPLQSANRLRDRMHESLMGLSSETRQIDANKSGHFVWVDQPELIEEAVKLILEKIG